MQTIAVHRTFEKDPLGKRKMRFYVSDGEGAERMELSGFSKWASSLDAGTILRFTQVNATDIALRELAERGITVRYAYWHDTGIPAGKSPEEIAALYANCAESIFRDFVARPDLARLRMAVSLRNAILSCYNGALVAIRQSARNAGFVDKDEIPADAPYAKAIEEIKTIRRSVKSEEGTMLDTEVNNLARSIPECVLFNRVSDFKDSMIIAATVVAHCGGMDRFPDVASWWHFSGLHVVDGHSPKRRKGVNLDWNPMERLAGYHTGQAIIKNRNNKWRDIFDVERAKEYEAHDAKCPNCKTKDGHCTGRAIRKVVKEIWKQFWVTANGREWQPAPTI